MITVMISSRTDKSVAAIWDLIVNLKKLFRLVKFVQKDSISYPIKEGLEFYDTSTILWVPMDLKHKVIEIVDNRKFKMKVFFPFRSGEMEQEIFIKDMGKYRNVDILINFDINIPLINFIIGLVLKKRLRQMIIGTFKNMESKLKDKVIITVLK